MRTERRKRYEIRYRKTNRAYLRSRARIYYRKNADRIKQNQAKHNAVRRLRTYGITADVETKMLREQKHRCAVCKGVEPKSKGGKTWHIDHNHSSGAVRGLLCQGCNLLLGHAKDSVLVLKAAIRYLQKHQKAVKLEAR